MAQDNRDFRYYDKSSYEYYDQKEWDELIKVGNEALKLILISITYEPV